MSDSDSRFTPPDDDSASPAPPDDARPPAEAAAEEDEPESWSGGIHGDLRHLELGEQRVLIRSDMRLELDASGELTSDASVRAALPTIEHARQAGARVIVAAHSIEEAVPSQAGPVRAAPSLEPLAAHLAALLECDVFLPDDCVSDAARRVILDLRPGQVCVLENLARHPAEFDGDASFAARLAAYADVYVNEAPQLIHQRWASLASIVPQVRHHALGLGLMRELDQTRALVEAKTGLGLIVVADELEAVVNAFDSVASRLSRLVVLGAAASLLRAARPLRSASDQPNPELAGARGLLQRFDQLGIELVLPKTAEFEQGSARRSLTEALRACSNRVAVELQRQPRSDLRLVLDVAAEASLGCVVSPHAMAEVVDRGPEIFYSRLGPNLLPLVAGGRFAALEALAHAAN